MRQAARAAWILAVLLGTPVSIQSAIFDWARLFELMDELRERAEAPSSDRDHKAEFDRICAQVPVAPSLTESRLLALIEDCKALRVVLERSTDPQAKILLKRLQMCEDFFVYSLEVRSAGAGSDS